LFVSKSVVSRSHLAADPAIGMAASIAAVALGSLAAGALWCFAAVTLPCDCAPLILPIGGALGAYLRWQGFSGRRGACCAVLATLAAFTYAQFLFGAVRIAQLMGSPLRDVLFKADTMLIVHAAWVDLQRRDWIFLALGVLLGIAVVAYRRPQTST
jgi:hypothetical protein